MGRDALVEAVLRYAIRDFPADKYCRSQLAALLRDIEREDEAEILLRDSMRAFPRDVVCRTQLADLWQASGKLDAAETLLREIIERLAPNLISFVLLARVHARKAQKAQHTSHTGEPVSGLKKALDVIGKALRINRRNTGALDAQTRIKSVARQLEVDDFAVGRFTKCLGACV